jgi:hypothetical protein
MSVDNFIPELWSARLLANLDKALVIASVCNTSWEGEVRNVGDTVRIQRPNNLTVAAYPASADITYEAPTSTTRSLVINQDRYFAFTVDDLDAVQANVGLVDQFTRRAAYSMADDFDTFLAGLYTGAGAGNVNLTLSSGDFYATAVTAGKNLDLQNVPRSGRFMVVTPAGYAKLLTDTKFTQASDLGDSVVVSGSVGRVAGFDVLISNNIVNSATTVHHYLYGTADAITFARQLLGTPEAVRREGRFEDAVRGRMAYGALVVEPNALGTIVATE